MLPETDCPEIQQPVTKQEPPPYDPRKLNLYKLSSLICEARRAVSEEMKRASKD